MLGLVEPGRGELGDQQPQALDLLGGEDALEQLAEVGLGDLMPARDVAQVRPRGQEERGRELGQVGLGDVEIDVEALVLGVELDPRRREKLVADGVQGMRQGPEAEREEVAAADLRGVERGQLAPARDPLGQPGDRPDGERLAAGHRHFAGHGAGEVVALLHVLAPFFHDPWLVLLAHAAELLEIGHIVDGAVRGPPAPPKIERS